MEGFQWDGALKVNIFTLLYGMRMILVTRLHVTSFADSLSQSAIKLSGCSGMAT